MGIRNSHLEPLILFLKQLQVDARMTSQEALWLQRCGAALESAAHSMTKLRERDYLAMILRLTSRKDLESWLAQNPPPPYWLHGRYAWAYTEMVIGERLTFRRRHAESE